jgi:PPP family 3-phenylpropionic acid transporter
VTERVDERSRLGQQGSSNIRNVAAWSVSGGYLWYFAAIGAFGPFASLYYRTLKFDGLELGILAALPALAVALSGPLWGTMADTLSAHRLLLRIALALCSAVALILTQASTFASVVPLVGLLAIAQAPVSPLLDGYAVSVAERLGTTYGRLRVWGSLGYTVAALTVGRLMGDQVSRLILVAYAGCLGLSWLSAIGLPSLSDRTVRRPLGGPRLLLRNRPLVLLLLVAYLTASSAAIMNAFLGIHLKDLGGSANLLGVAIAIGAASELPVVAFGGWFLTRLGPARLVALAITTYAVRFVAYGTITNPEWILPVQTLHGLSFGAFLIASVTLAHRLAGREHAAGAQALLAAVSFGCGSITGSLVGGALLDRVGTTGLFRGGAVVLLVALGVVFVGARVVGVDWHEKMEPEPVMHPQESDLPPERRLSSQSSRSESSQF